MGETENTGELAFANPQEQTMDWGGHPLFPRAETETGPDRRKFDIIHIQRIKSDGSREVCPKAWRGSDLRSWEQIVEAYGGGTYQLLAQCGRTFRYQAYSDKLYFGGPSKPFGEFTQSETPAPVHEMAPKPAPVVQSAPVNVAPMAPAPIPPGYAHPAPYGYPYPPPAASGNAEMLAMFRAVIESSNSDKAALMRILLERSGGKETGSLEVVREILPLIQGNANGTLALLKGVELARGLMGPAPSPPAAEMDLALLGQVLRMVTPAATAPAAAVPAAAPVAPSAPAATIAPPPGVAPPGWTWAYTMHGWTLVQPAHVQQYPTQTPAPIAPTPQAQTTAQPATNPSEPAKAASSPPTDDIQSDAEMAQLFASLSKLTGSA